MKILVGVDGSEESYNALRYAINEAKLKKAKLTAVHSEVGGARETLEDVRRGRKILEKAEEMMKDQGIEFDIQTLVRGEKTAADIVKFAEENGYNHIVVGSRGRTGISRVLLGSVAEEIARRAHCAVTIIREIC